MEFNPTAINNDKITEIGTEMNTIKHVVLRYVKNEGFEKIAVKLPKPIPVHVSNM